MKNARTHVLILAALIVGLGVTASMPLPSPPIRAASPNVGLPIHTTELGATRHLFAQKVLYASLTRTDTTGWISVNGAKEIAWSMHFHSIDSVTVKVIVKTRMGTTNWNVDTCKIDTVNPYNANHHQFHVVIRGPSKQTNQAPYGGYVDFIGGNELIQIQNVITTSSATDSIGTNLYYDQDLVLK